MSHRGLALSLAALAGLSAGTAPAQTAYALGGDGVSLLTFSISNPGSVGSPLAFSGAPVDGVSFLDSIDFRPATGELFGYRSFDATYYRVNTATGALTLASASPVGATTNTPLVGIDFNPTIDRLRVVTETDQNVVFNPNTGTAAGSGTPGSGISPLAYAAGDANAGANPQVIDNAYTNSNLGTATASAQYVLDYGTDSLATLANNTGVLSTVGRVRLADGTLLDFDAATGFDIFTSATGVNTGYALLTVGGVQGLYSVNLGTGVATSLGTLGAGTGLQAYGLAVTPVAAVPAPPTLVGLAGGVLAFGLRAARRRVLG